MKKPTILGFDTSGAYCGAALLRAGEVVAGYHEDMKKGQAERLFPMLEGLLADTKTSWADLDAIGVGTGPGNFTGIRIGVSAARGLALSLKIPAVGVGVFDALAYGRADHPTLLTRTAPRDQFYVKGLNGVAPDEIALVSADELPKVSPAIAVVGEGSQEVAQALGCTTEPAKFAPASAIACVAAERWEQTTEAPTPIYFRPPDAAPASDPPPTILP